MGEKIVFCDKVYLGKGMNRKKLDKLKKKIETKPLLCGEYLIAIPENPNSQLDILQARQLVQDYYSRYPLRVVGVASNYDEALEIVERIVQECLRVRGDCALKEYLTC
ncbi:MAG: hypothetical protein IJ833_07310 [Lachnospiraceae bacterium]|nr:hypothetical protein [Lachnospiraceae bacterium]